MLCKLLHTFICIINKDYIECVKTIYDQLELIIIFPFKSLSDCDGFYVSNIVILWSFVVPPELLIDHAIMHTVTHAIYSTQCQDKLAALTVSVQSQATQMFH